MKKLGKLETYIVEGTKKVVKYHQRLKCTRIIEDGRNSWMLRISLNL